ncbi:unnamed protein product [marine sediment metagenome]|uniref:Uncharacterized protein n=1 Tax=marine sediment metagenome TaxID=412755 RepID=X1AN91_9ZZZZ
MAGLWFTDLSGEYDKSNWQRFPNGSYNGYYINLQKMIDAGLRDPSDFIEANYKSGEEYEGQEDSIGCSLESQLI